jgi:hypothetical protein
VTPSDVGVNKVSSCARMGMKAEFTDERKTWVCMKARATTEITVLVKIYCLKYDDEL